jgi:hypothetical protein
MSWNRGCREVEARDGLEPSDKALLFGFRAISYNIGNSDFYNQSVTTKQAISRSADRNAERDNLVVPAKTLPAREDQGKS